MRAAWLAALFLLSGCGSAASAPDASPPVVCGDGVAMAAEACDGADLRGSGCIDFGFNAGTLACFADCAVDVHGCRIDELCDNGKDDDGDAVIDCVDQDCADHPACAACGDRQVTAGEQCDDGNRASGDCCEDCRAEPGCEVERNDTSAAAMELVLDGGAAEVRGHIGIPGDVDVYAVAIPTRTSGTLTAETRAFAEDGSCASMVDSFVEILDHTTAVVADDDDSGEDTCSLASYAGLAPGLAQIRVTASPLATLPAFGYRLRVRLALAPCGDGVHQPGEECEDGNAADGDGCSSICHLEARTDAEPNDTPATANGPFAPPFLVAGSIDTSQADNFDSDWFGVNLAQPANLRIETIDDEHPECDSILANVALHDGGGALLLAGQSTAPESRVCSSLTTADLAGPTAPQLAAGRYLVKVAARRHPGRYKLFVTYTSRCGNGVVEPPEACDGAAACDATCRVPQ